MIVTEKEAELLWCPHARDSYGNRFVDEQGVERGSICVGSKCMAWRWLQSTKHSGRGYCGLSGTV